MTVIEVLRRATGYLENHGSSSPRLDAELLLAHVLGIRRLDLYLQHERPLDEAELAPFRDLTARRGRGEPVAYMTGHREFMALDFEVTPAVLVPNPDTEPLVQRAVAWARERGRQVRVADVGTGSGCIAVAVARYAEQTAVVATDIDPDALDVARRNVARHQVEARVELRLGDLLAAALGDFDLVCANLPYIAEGSELPAEVLAQPHRALFAGQEGVELNARLLTEAEPRLRPRGAVMIEIDGLTEPALVALASRLFPGHRVHRDGRGTPRFLEAWKS